MFQPVLKLSLIAIATTLSINAFSSPVPKVVYGEDDRYLLHEYPNAAIQMMAKSTAAMIDKSFLKSKIGNRIYLQDAKTLQQNYNVCPDENFAKELTVAECSGALVAPNLILTAGHCVKDKSDCSSAKWVFDYRADKVNRKKKYVLEENVYSCTQILVSSYNKDTDSDYALIKLDRDVTDRAPLPVRTGGKIEDDTELVVIGHPSGLPTVIADNGFVQENSEDNVFKANLDTFTMNSGSPVLNKRTGVIEGILIRGQRDYEWDRYDSCLRPNFWGDPDFPGETITRTTTVKALERILRYFN